MTTTGFSMCGFSVTGFRTADKLTLRSVPQPDFRTTVFVPLPRFLLQDEALRDISNDAKVLYALLLDGVCPPLPFSGT